MFLVCFFYLYCASSGLVVYCVVLYGVVCCGVVCRGDLCRIYICVLLLCFRVCVYVVPRRVVFMFGVVS